MSLILAWAVLQVYNHWGPVDEHKTLPTERLNELFGSMASYYEPPSNQVACQQASKQWLQSSAAFVFLSGSA